MYKKEVPLSASGTKSLSFIGRANCGRTAETFPASVEPAISYETIPPLLKPSKKTESRSMQILFEM
jgi:hypothetical protein